MAVAARESSIPWYSWLALVAVLAVGVLIVLFTQKPVVPDGLRWTVTGLWIAYTVGIGLRDFVLGSARAPSRAAGARDDQPFDWWTISHTGAGLVFGVWYVPLLWVVILVFAWEAFEYFVPGFGETEILLNRAVDIGVALAGWLVVVVIAAIATGTAFPWI
ncbi:MAG TPA: hypothetical protein VGQ47_03900 [Candidatus Limnocylindrales bacterium]|jgi:hypothetical protein|nr:hypothetical protein [Candidatus Limnocylindrales bacterium]